MEQCSMFPSIHRQLCEGCQKAAIDPPAKILTQKIKFAALPISNIQGFELPRWKNMCWLHEKLLQKRPPEKIWTACCTWLGLPAASWNTSGNDSSFAVFLVGPPVCWRGSPLHLFYFPSSAYSFQHDWLCRVVGCNSKMATTVTDLIGGKAAESELTKIRCVPANLVFLMKR